MTFHHGLAINSLNFYEYSGDGTLSSIDVRAKSSSGGFTQSEDQEDELLSSVSIRGCVRLTNCLTAPVYRYLVELYVPRNRSGTKLVVGTQLGILSIFDRKKGFADCVDRVKGCVRRSFLPFYTHL